MLDKTKNTIYNKAFLPTLFLTILLSTPFVASAFSLSEFVSFFKNASATKKVNVPREENLQSMKVFETNKAYADSATRAVDVDLVDKQKMSFEVPKEFEDDLEIGDLENHSENAVYTVQKGDSIYSIASYFGVSVETIMTFNHMDKITVHVGQVLEVPSVSGILYEVDKGDTLAQISKKYDLDVEDIALYNGLSTTDKLAVGDEIFLPGAKENNTKPKTVANKNKTTTSKNILTSTPKGKQWANGDTAHLNTPVVIAKYSNMPKFDGYYTFPAPGTVRTQKMHGNNGVDLAGKVGIPVLAAAGGVVSVAKTGGYNFGYGNYIKVTHDNGTETLYGHLSRVNVTVGQSVSKGEQIGSLGSTGNSTGPHLHFEVHGAYNPFAW